MLKKRQPLVNPEAFRGHHQKDHHRVLSRRFTGYGPLHNHQLILLEWCLDLEQINSYIKMETMKGEPQHNQIQLNDD